jgi:SAM-dependent methyltransferase
MPPPGISDAHVPQVAVETSPSAHPPKLDLSRRADLIELMDQPCSYEDLHDCLRDIAKVNRLTFAYRPTLAWLDQLVAAAPTSTEPLRIVDVGCGYGDTLRRISAWAIKRNIAVALTGVDLNPNAIRAAKEATPPHQNIEWLTADALLHDPQDGTDVVISSLFTHHLPDPEIVRFLAWMESKARRGWFINDLHRQAVPYHAFRLWAKVSRWHSFVKNDGPVSIRRSFVPANWHYLCAAAEIDLEAVSIKEHRPARLCVGRIK